MFALNENWGEGPVRAFKTLKGAKDAAKETEGEVLGSTKSMFSETRPKPAPQVVHGVSGAHPNKIWLMLLGCESVAGGFDSAYSSAEDANAACVKANEIGGHLDGCEFYVIDVLLEE